MGGADDPMMRTSILLLAAIFLPVASAGLVDPEQPVAAVAVQVSPSSVLVAWTPGPDNVDGYLVYGLQDGTAVALASVPASTTQVEVPAGYASYEVAAQGAGDWHTPVVGVVTSDDPCVYISATPPAVVVGNPWDCIPTEKVQVEHVTA